MEVYYTQTQKKNQNETIPKILNENLLLFVYFHTIQDSRMQYAIHFYISSIFIHCLYSLSLRISIFSQNLITVHWQIKFISLHSQGYIPLYFLNRGNHLFSIFPHDSSAIYLSHNLPNTYLYSFNIYSHFYTFIGLYCLFSF